MRLVTVSASTSGAYVVPLDIHADGFCVNILVVPLSGTPAPTIQHTFENVLASTSAAANALWLNHPTLVSVSTTVEGTYTAPVHAIRAFASLPGDFRVFVIQSGLTH